MKNKRAKKRRTFRYRGQKMASKAEVKYAKGLDDLKLTWMYEADVFPWIPPKKKYTPDFVLPKKDGEKMYIEFKGYLRPVDKTKMRNIKIQYPDLDIRLVFMNAKRPIYDGSKTSYGEWAGKHGYKWHDLEWVGRKYVVDVEKLLPKEWLKEVQK